VSESNKNMKPVRQAMKAWPTILFLVLAMLVDASLTGCASCRQRSETSAYQGPMQAPEENLLW